MGDIRKINVGGDSIGIRGLDQAIEDLTGGFADRSDPEVAAAMLARLEPRNYFAPSALDQYAAAFVREFRKALGQPHQSGTDGGLEVRVLGPGCPRCDQLHERLAKVLAETGIAADLDKVTDVKAIAASGVLVTPGLMINGKVVSVGKVPSERQLKDWLREHDRS